MGDFPLVKKKISEIHELFKRYTTPKLEEYERIVITKYISRGSKILDACSGAGRISVPLAKIGYSVLSVDYDESFIRYAKKKWNHIKNLRFMQADIRDFYELEKFDACIVMENSFEHIEENYLKAFVNISQSVKPGGIVIFTMHSLLFPATLFRLIAKNILNPLRKNKWNTFITRKGIFYRIYAPWYVVILFNKLGFKLLDVYNVKNMRLVKLPPFLKWFGWYLVLVFEKIRK